MHAIQSDPLVGRYLGVGHSRTIDDTRERFERMLGFQRAHGYTLWAVTLADGGELIGDCGLIPLEGSGPEVELGYRFGSASWGKGYATEAASACRNIGFDRFGLERIYVDIHPENEGSQNVARKLGGRLIGPAKHNGFDVLRFVLERLPQ
jgi:RimJ/RimL family protein N-acetyltransferase